MKHYGVKENGKYIESKKVFGMSGLLEDLGLVDFIGVGQYDGQRYYYLRKVVNGEFEFIKTTSEKKKMAYMKIGWELIKNKGTNEVPAQFSQVELIINDC
ncbi:hypothetical protein KGF86_01755 [Ornithinibacillus massiliensis]|uniref:Uncharacterized protein n=1 Tax=Ornithinibacillus massiliensis TaxID=1944633 RepID=A0ABS5M9D7_9BACI|nr:hypothetical protein [Ornithinibacillus massiliensis]MBS3678929.1 hypothetical protein [Ornithinibacillus massiliensis]